MASSILGVAAWVSVAVAQAPNPGTHDGMSPWLGQQPRVLSIAPTDPATKLPLPARSRTVFYKKDQNTGVVPTAAADLAAPIAADPPASDTTKMPPAEPEPPKTEELFRLESEAQYVAKENARRKRLREDPKIKDKTAIELNDVVFPRHPLLSKQSYAGRTLSPAQILIEPNYVCYGRLLFEEKNAERYGWTMGPMQVFYSAGQFFSDVSNLPYKVGSYPKLWFDCSAGNCLPGDPVPYMIYPPGASVTGGVTQAAVTVALYAIFP